MRRVLPKFLVRSTKMVRPHRCQWPTTATTPTATPFPLSSTTSVTFNNSMHELFSVVSREECACQQGLQCVRFAGLEQVRFCVPRWSNVTSDTDYNFAVLTQSTVQIVFIFLFFTILLAFISCQVKLFLKNRHRVHPVCHPIVCTTPNVLQEFDV